MSDTTIATRFNEIYNAYHKLVLSYIAAKCGSADDISDIAQETFVEVYQTLCRRGVGYARSERAVVMKIAQRKVAQHYSRIERQPITVPIHTENEDGDDVAMTDLEADEYRTEDFVIDRMMLDNARQIIMRKPDDVKRVLYMFFDLDMTLAEIAKELGVSETTVKNKLYRTLKELRNLLK